MFVWLEEIVGPENVPIVYWAIVAVAALAVLWALYRLFKNLRSGTYVAGGRNRKTRLAIMDATAVDTHRRLVLVRRDDVEHLLLIGGHSDIVVERDIRIHATAKRPTMVQEQAHAEPPAPVMPKAQVQNVEHVTRSQPQIIHASAPQREAAPAAPRPLMVRANPQPIQRPVVAPPKPRSADEFDANLLKELETALDTPEPAPQPQQPQPVQAKPSLDDEMAKLLGELSSHKR